MLPVDNGAWLYSPLARAQNYPARQFALLGQSEQTLGHTEQSSKTSRRFLALLGQNEQMLGETEQSKLAEKGTSGGQRVTLRQRGGVIEPRNPSTSKRCRDAPSRFVHEVAKSAISRSPK
jgi:hypothetical protein